MTIAEIEEVFYRALKADTYARGEADITSIGITCVIVTRKLQSEGVENVQIAQALISLGKKKNWILLTKTGESMMSTLKELNEIIPNSVPLINNAGKQ